MRTAYSFSILIATALVFGNELASPAGAKGGSMARQVYNPEAICNSWPTLDQSSLKSQIDRAVFQVVWTKSSGEEVPIGTASLVDDQGYFLTAAHVTHFYRDRRLKLIHERMIAGQPFTYSFIAKLESSDKDYKLNDLVIIKAENWQDHDLPPVPLRMGRPLNTNGFFVSYSDTGPDRMVTAFEQRFVYTRNSSFEFSGSVFPGNSGALMVDDRGRAFALVRAHPNIQDVRLGELPAEEAYKVFVQERGTFSAQLFKESQSTIVTIPQSSMIKEILAKGIDGQLTLSDYQRLENRASQVSSIDVLHLINAIDETWFKGLKKANPLLHTPLLLMIMQLSQTHCLAEEFLLTAFVPGEVGSQDGPLSLRQDEASNIESFSPNILGDVGAFTLQMLARNGSAPIAEQSLLAEIAGATLRGAVVPALADIQAEDEEGQRPYYAQLFTNLALAERHLQRLGQGSEEQVAWALAAANAFGGTPTSYDLSAQIASQNEEFGKALAFYERAIEKAGQVQTASRLRYQQSLVKSFAFIERLLMEHDLAQGKTAIKGPVWREAPPLAEALSALTAEQRQTIKVPAFNYEVWRSHAPTWAYQHL